MNALIRFSQKSSYYVLHDFLTSIIYLVSDGKAFDWNCFFFFFGFVKEMKITQFKKVSKKNNNNVKFVKKNYCSNRCGYCGFSRPHHRSENDWKNHLMLWPSTDLWSRLFVTFIYLFFLLFHSSSLEIFPMELWTR